MVLLLIRAPIFGLIVTVISVIAELAFLAAALQFLNYVTCRSLRNEEHVVKIRWYRIKMYAITALAMIMFVTVECVTSVFSDAAVYRMRNTEKCFRNTAPVTHTSVGSNLFEGRPIFFRCIKVDGRVLTHMAGNSSMESAAISCDRDSGYSYRIGEVTKMGRTEQMAVHCNENELCAAILLERDVLYVSSGFKDKKPAKEEISMMPTNVSKLDKGKIDARVLSKRLVKIYESAVHMEGEIRRRLLLETTRSTCEFEQEERQATKVLLSVVIVAAAVWITSLALYAISRLLTPHIFFDVRDPMHWAKYACHDARVSSRSQPVLQRLHNDTRGRVRVMA
ncbi:unnamed protein product [Agarophyton chilense]